jgi:signal peptidase II
LRVLYASLFVVIADQVTKFFVKGLKIEWLGISLPGMPYGSSKQVFGNFVKLTFIENPGMAFGINVGPKMFLTVFTILASFVILYYIYKHRHDSILLRLALAFILAGAVGNLIDRTFYGLIYNYAPLFHGRVVDFVQVEFWDFTFLGKTYTTWPIFNVADVSVTIGFLIIIFFNKKIFKTEEENPAPGSAAEEIPGENNGSTSGTAPLDASSLLNNNGSTLSIEDTKQNPDERPSGTEETKDR